MLKKHFSIFVAAMLLLFGTESCSASNRRISPDVTPDPSKPNIILILTDDQPVQSLQYMPNVQKELVGKGINFTNGFVTTPLCCPSRASILTGLYAHNHGVLTDRPPQGGATVFKDASTIAAWLKQSGYRTALMGKYLNNYDALTPAGYVPPGWDEWDVFMNQGKNDMGYYYGYTLSDNGRVIKYGTDSKDYSADVMTEKALKFIQESGNQPFFLILAYYNPHQTYQAADRYKNMFKTDAEFSPYRPPNFLEGDLSDKPDWLRLVDKLDTAYVDHVYQRILRSLMAVDDGVGRITNLLDEQAERDRTAIFYMSDNGMSLGDNAVFGKNCPYDACTHVPFVVSYPPLMDKSGVDSHFVLNVDLAPTFANLAHAMVPGPVDGVSFLPLFSDPNVKWRDSILLEHFQETGNGSDEEGGLVAIIPTFHAVRTKDWKYIEYDTGEKELYDLQVDPYEMNNIAGQVGHEAILTTLQAQLNALKGD